MDVLLTDIACWELIDNDCYSIRSVYTHETDEKVTIIDIYYTPEDGVTSCNVGI